MGPEPTNSDQLSSSQYRLEEPQKWWQKDINPVVSFIFLVAAMVIVFVMGALFMREYIRIWNEISQREQEIFLPEKLPQKLDEFEEIIIP